MASFTVCIFYYNKNTKTHQDKDKGRGKTIMFWKLESKWTSGEKLTWQTKKHGSQAGGGEAEKLKQLAKPEKFSSRGEHPPQWCESGSDRGAENRGPSWRSAWETKQPHFKDLGRRVGVLFAQSCPTLWDPMDGSPPGSSVHGILQARILEWVAIAFSRGSSQPRDRTQVSCIAGRFCTVWTTREA